MRYMPLFIDLHNREVLLIGGGKVALKRGRQYVEAGARLRVIAPEILPEFAGMPGVTLVQRGATASDVTNEYFMVVIASSNSEVNEIIAAECERLGLLFNRSDLFTAGNFINGSTIARGEIICSTVSGGVPAISQFLQQKIGQLVTPELVELATLLSELRPAIKESEKLQGSRHEFIASWVNDETLARLRDEGSENLRQEILACL